MNNPDATEAIIDRALSGLRNVPVPTGLESRVHHRLATAAAARSTPAFSFASLLRTLSASAPLYTAAALIALTFITLHSRRAATPHPGASATAATTSQQHSSDPLEVTSPQRAQNSFSRTALHSTNRSFEGAGLQSRRKAPNKNAALAAEGVAAPDPDAIALAETLAPSHPAPPMPLTRQERLMLSILRSGDQEQIAALNPVERDARFAREQADFSTFFSLPNPSIQSAR